MILRQCTAPLQAWRARSSPDAGKRAGWHDPPGQMDNLDRTLPENRHQAGTRRGRAHLDANLGESTPPCRKNMWEEKTEHWYRSKARVQICSSSTFTAAQQQQDPPHTSQPPATRSTPVVLPKCEPETAGLVKNAMNGDSRLGLRNGDAHLLLFRGQ